jgi:hypothetical protein
MKISPAVKRWAGPLVLLLVGFVLAAVLVHLVRDHVPFKSAALWFSALSLLAATVTINWTYPATGATSPTAAQVANQSEVIVDVTMDGTATSVTLTHNMAISAADLALGFPDVLLEPESVHFGDTMVPYMDPTTGKTTNTVVVTLAAVAGRFKAKIKRPNTIER